MPVVEVTAGTFDAEVLESSVPVLLEFWAEWSGPCRFTGPILEEFSAKYGDKVKVVRVNIDNESEIATQCEAVSVPTFLLFVDGSVVEFFGGARPLEVLESELANYL